MRSVLLLVLAATMSSAQEPGRIDFRNLIPGQLDAPVYESDGVTRLEGNRYAANLMVLCCSDFPGDPPTLIQNGIALSSFQDGGLAGYWQPQIVTVGWAGSGGWGWAQVRILDRPPGLDGFPLLVRAVTAPFAFQLSSEPVTLTNLNAIILREFPAVIDFRNQIPGVLDAPIIEFDGATRLEGGAPTYAVQLFVDLEPFEESGPKSLEPIGVMSAFQSGDLAGYWRPLRLAVHGRNRDAVPGERVWVQIGVFDHWGTVPRGSSEPMRVDLAQSTPLVGLKSFRLEQPPPEIDFRNYVRGLLDAPVFRADGTNRLSGSTGCWAALYGGLEMHKLEYLGSVPFESRGYLVSDLPEGEVWPGYVASNVSGVIVLPFAKAGDRVWFQMRAWEPHQGVTIPYVFPPPRFTGQSEVFSLVVGSTPTPLVGLKSFRLQPASIAATRQQDRLVLRWSAGDGTVKYVLEEASTIGEVVEWKTSNLTPLLETLHLEWTWVSDWVATGMLDQSMAFYRIRLLDP